METPLLTWLLIIAVIAAIFVMDAVGFLRKNRNHTASRKHHHLKHSQHIIGMGSEKEMFYVPGDSMPVNVDDYDKKKCDGI
ncbi:MAG: hypothetical protein NC204_03890 [Candidatus Amulumruptor caecigallinarius]|nr:hypothetical protein [Candidatus Amulumruptor caecigallinarius]